MERNEDARQVVMDRDMYNHLLLLAQHATDQNAGNAPGLKSIQRHVRKFNTALSKDHAAELQVKQQQSAKCREVARHMWRTICRYKNHGLTREVTVYAPRLTVTGQFMETSQTIVYVPYIILGRGLNKESLRVRDVSPCDHYPRPNVDMQVTKIVKVPDDKSDVWGKRQYHLVIQDPQGPTLDKP